MKFILIVAIATSIYVCAMDVVNKFTNSLDFTQNSLSVVNVSIDGEVNSPGSYYLPSGATLKDLVAYAGGFTDIADVSNLSASEVLTNGKKYFVPTASVEEVIIQVSINNSTIQELEQVPGIGTSLAARIVAYRIENGNFSSVEELCNVKGIKEATLEKIRPYITL